LGTNKYLGGDNMSIFEFAMQMELDGEKFYRELAEKSSNAGLKKIFSRLFFAGRQPYDEYLFLI
jgi:hypothetical protein